MKIGLIVVDDGIYTHQWVRAFLESGSHTVCAGACLSPLFAIGFNPHNGFARTILSRTKYYGLRATAKFGWRFLKNLAADASFRMSGRGQAHSVHSLLSQAGIPLIPCPHQNVNDPQFQANLKAHEPDVLVCTFSQKAEQTLRGLASLGCLNIHFSCLPENAGREPVFWSLLRGSGYGLTVYRMNAGLDSGEMLVQQKLEMEGLHSLDAAIQRVCVHVSDALSAALQKLENGTGAQIVSSELNSWPEPRDIQAFHEAGYRFI